MEVFKLEVSDDSDFFKMKNVCFFFFLWPGSSCRCCCCCCCCAAVVAGVLITVVAAVVADTGLNFIAELESSSLTVLHYCNDIIIIKAAIMELKL